MRGTGMLAGLLIAVGARADDRIVVQVPALLDSAAPIAGSVRRECNVEGMIGNHVFEKVSERYPGTGQLADPKQAGSERLLKLTIIGVMGVGGGAWSGTKSITIRADLEQNSKVFASKVLSRQSGGGFAGGLKGTCAIMERIAVALGRDVAAWMPIALIAAAPAEAPAPASPAPPPPQEKPTGGEKQ